MRTLQICIWCDILVSEEQRILRFNQELKISPVPILLTLNTLINCKKYLLLTDTHYKNGLYDFSKRNKYGLLYDFFNA